MTMKLLTLTALFMLISPLAGIGLAFMLHIN